MTERIYNEKKYGKLIPGDVTRFKDDPTLYRYLGVAPALPPGIKIRGTFLVFQKALLLAPEGAGDSYRYLDVSKTKRAIPGRTDILEKTVGDAKIIGNIPERVWSLLHSYQMETACNMKLGGEGFEGDNLYNFLLTRFSNQRGEKEESRKASGTG